MTERVTVEHNGELVTLEVPDGTSDADIHSFLSGSKPEKQGSASALSRGGEYTREVTGANTSGDIAIDLSQPSDMTLGQAASNIGAGLTNKKQWQETKQGMTRAVKAMPAVTESVGRGFVAAIPGTFGDINQLAGDVIGYENPLPTTEDILKYVPRITKEYQGSKEHEMVGGLLGLPEGGAGRIGKAITDVTGLTEPIKAGANIVKEKALAPAGFTKGIVKGAFVNPEGTSLVPMGEAHYTPESVRAYMAGEIPKEQLVSKPLDELLTSPIDKAALKIAGNQVPVKGKIGEATGERLAQDYSSPWKVLTDIASTSMLGVPLNATKRIAQAAADRYLAGKLNLDPGFHTKLAQDIKGAVKPTSQAAPAEVATQAVAPVTKSLEQIVSDIKAANPNAPDSIIKDLATQQHINNIKQQYPGVSTDVARKQARTEIASHLDDINQKEQLAAAEQRKAQQLAEQESARKLAEERHAAWLQTPAGQAETKRMAVADLLNPNKGIAGHGNKTLDEANKLIEANPGLSPEELIAKRNADIKAQAIPRQTQSVGQLQPSKVSSEDILAQIRARGAQTQPVAPVTPKQAAVETIINNGQATPASEATAKDIAKSMIKDGELQAALQTQPVNPTDKLASMRAKLAEQPEGIAAGNAEAEYYNSLTRQEKNAYTRSQNKAAAEPQAQPPKDVMNMMYPDKDAFEQAKIIAELADAPFEGSYIENGRKLTEIKVPQGTQYKGMPESIQQEMARRNPEKWHRQVKIESTNPEIAGKEALERLRKKHGK